MLYACVGGFNPLKHDSFGPMFSINVEMCRLQKCGKLSSQAQKDETSDISNLNMHM